MNESREEIDFLAVNLEVAGITKGNPPPRPKKNQL